MDEILKKTFVARSRVYSNQSGSIVKSFVENYLRSDVSCFSSICKNCSRNTKKRAKPLNTIKKFKGCLYYVIPTYEAIRYHYPVFAQENCILTETLFVQIEERKLFYKLKSLLYDVDNCVIYFSSEHFVNTYTSRQSEESEENRNERAARQVGRWYSSHLNGKVKILVVTKNLLESDKKEKDITVMHLKEFLRYFQEDQKEIPKEKMEEIFTEIEKEQKEDSFRIRFEDHLPQTECEKLRLAKKNIVRGLLKVNRFRFREAFVKLDETLDVDILHEYLSVHKATEMEKKEETKEEKKKKKVFDFVKIEIRGEVNRNRAINMDEVFVEILPRSSWEDQEIAEGKIIGFHEIHHKSRDFVACISVRSDRQMENLYSRNVLCLPLDRRVPKIRLKTTQRAQLRGQRFLVRIFKWDSNSRYPNGRYIRPLGRIGNIETEIKSILVESGVYDWSLPFAGKVIRELPLDTFEISPDEISRRRFFGAPKTFICSIDPIGCTDIDDAISYEKNPKKPGTVEIGVHIADVSHFVRPGSEIDLEARKRTTSIYMVDRRLDMIPGRLSSNLCSLHMKKNRLAVSVVWTLDEKTMDIKDVWFGESVIFSAYSFHYNQASRIMNGKPPEKPIILDYWKECKIEKKDVDETKFKLDFIRKFSMKLRQERILKGGLELNSLEKCDFQLDEDGNPIKISYHDSDQIHKVIEEMMILANVYVAKEIYKNYKETAVIRNHPLPRNPQLEEVRNFGKIKGFKILTYSNIVLGKSLISAIDLKDPLFNTLLRSFATKAMKCAEYVSPKEGQSLSHYGLGLEIYTHFTSPIRRYADLIVHRILKSTFSKVPVNIYSKEELDEICGHMNRIRSQTKEVQRNTSSWYQALYFANTPGVVGEGIIYKITKKFMKVFLPNYRVNSVVFLTDRDGNLYLPIDKRKKKKKWGTREGEDEDDEEEEDEVIQKEKFEIELSEDELSVKIKLPKNTVKFELFDHVLVGVDVRETHSHIPQIKLDLYSHEVFKRGGKYPKGDYRSLLREAVEKKRMKESNESSFQSVRKRKGENFQTSLSHGGEYDFSKIATNFESSLTKEIDNMRIQNVKFRIEKKIEKIIELTSSERYVNFSEAERKLISQKEFFEKKLRSVEILLKEEASKKELQ